MKIRHLSSIIITIQFFTFSSCEFKNNSKEVIKYTLQEKGNFEFNIGYSPMIRYSGTVEIYDKEYLYFSDVMTNKCIDIVTLYDSILCRIPLNEITNLNEKIEDFFIKNLDSIIVLTQYTNQLLLINSKGSILNQINLNLFVSNVDAFEMYSSAYQDFCLNNSFLFHGSRILDLETSPYEDMIKSIKYLYGKSYSSPYFFKFSNVFSDSITLKTGLNGYYLPIVKSDSFLLESPYYYHTKDKLFCFSSYSNKVHEIDPSTLKIINEIVVVSDYTEISCSPVPINDKTIGNSELLNNNLQTQGAINRFFYDKYRNLYYIIVLQKVNEKAPKNERGANRPWSIILYDTNFEKLKEIKMPPLQYYPSNIIICREGILISTNNEMNDNYERTKAKYTLFEISQ